MYDLISLQKDIESLEKSGEQTKIIGYSTLGREIKALFKGKENAPQIFMQGAIHAREWVCMPLCIQLFKEYKGECGLWCVPAVNPDGIQLCQYGLKDIDDAKLKNFLLKVNGNSSDFSLWKANINAVDLNVNFDAKWGSGQQNIKVPAPSNFIGPYPLSENESRALVQFAQQINFDLSISYHARGEVIYYGFEGINPDPQAVTTASKITGYPAIESTGSAGGFKDWFVLKNKKVGLTIEVGKDGVPYDRLEDYLPQIVRQNKDLCDALSQKLYDKR